MIVMGELFYFYVRKFAKEFFAPPIPCCTRKLLRVFALIILFLFVAVEGARAAGEIDTIRLTETEKNWLAGHPVISIAPDPSFPPIEYFDENGSYRGISADYIAIIEEKLGIEFRVLRFKSWEEVLKKARKREVDVLPAAAQTPDRSKYVHFSDPHIVLPGVIITRKEVADDLTMEDLRGMRVSVVKSYVWHEFIGKDYPDLGLDLVPDLRTALKEVSLGVSDALIATLPVAIYYIEKEGITNLRVAGETGYFTRLSFATRKDWPEFNSIMQKTLAGISKEEKRAIREKWIHLDTDSPLLTKTFWACFTAGLGVVALVFVGILLWNRELKKRIDKRTHELNRELVVRRKTDESLRESEEKYRNLVENMKDIFYITDDKGLISYVSPVAEAIGGYKTSEIIGRPIIDFLHPEDVQSIAGQFREIISGKTEPAEYRLITKSGNVIWALTFAQPIFDKDRVVGVQGIITDITDIKKTEEKLTRSEEKYRTIIESIQEGYFEVDLAGRLVFFNDVLCDSSGYSRDELLGMAFQEYTTPASAERLYEVFHEVYRTGNPSEIVDYDILTKDGGIRYAELSTSLMVDPHGKPLGFRGVARDVTDKKRVEHEMQERRIYLEEVLRAAPDAVITLDKDNRIAEWNQGAERLFGYSPDEASGRDIDELIASSESLEEAAALSRQVLAGKKVPPLEVVRYRKDGSSVHVIVAGSPIMMGGESIGAVAIYTDITERKRMEELWRRYEFIVNAASDMMSLIDSRYVYEAVNFAYSRAHGLESDEIVGMSVADLWGDQVFHSEIKGHLERCFAGEEVNYQRWFEFKDLGLRYFDVTYYPYRTVGSEVTHTVVVSRDTTEYKRLNDALMESMDRFRSIVENSHEGILIVGDNYRFVYVNEELCRMLKYSRQELLERDFREFLDEEDRDLVTKRYIQRRSGELLPARYEFNIVRKDGTVRRVEISSSVVAQSGRETQTIAQLLDITERKNAEEKLIESEKRYRNILESIEEGYFEVDLAGKFTFFNDSLCRIAGLPREELLGLSNLEYTAPETAKTMYEEFNTIYKTGKPAELVDYEIVRMDGSKLVLELSATLRTNDEGKPIGFRGVARDVTERKAAEEEIRKSEEKYRTIIENIREGYFEIDPAGNITFFNDSACRILGYSSDELMGMNNREYTTPETAEKTYKVFNKIYRTENPCEIEDYEIIRKDGSVRILEVSAALMRDAKLLPVGFRGVLRDVTDRKRAEEQIRQSLKEKEIMLQEIHHRVKNNMQVVSSMLSLQARHITDERARELFEDSRSRIRSMSLVHEKLYLSHDISRIDCADYIRSLTNYLSQIYWVDHNIIRFTLDVDKVFFGIETATPFGLLANELVSNSLKHAFPGGRKGDIRIDLHSSANDGKYVFVVSDNGIGMPANLDFRKTETLGLQLVDTLITQLDATVEIDRSGGTTFRITFEELKYRKRM
jgi:PAS domain S-box-containing protein